MATSQELQDKLERKYCPPLDTALFLTIISDFDIANDDNFREVQQILDSLTEGIDAEEATGFDPSGSSGGGILASDDHGGNECHDTPEWSSNTDTTSLSQGMSALELEAIETGAENQKGTKRHVENDAQLVGQDIDAKEAMLIETFPTVKPFDIKWTLKKCKGNASLAIDELLNQTLLEETGGRHKGIEAFSDNDVRVRPRKARGKKKRVNMTELSTSDTEPSSSSVESRWEDVQRDIDFISDRMDMPVKQAASVYHKNGGSLQATIIAIIDAHMALQLDTQDRSIQRAAQDLAPSYPSIPLTRLLALIQLTHPSRTSAEDVAKALTTPPKHHSKTPIQISFRLPPPDLSEPTIPDPRHSSAQQNSLYHDGTPTITGSSNTPYSSHNTSSASLSTLRSQAFTQASAAYRKGKSDPLMGGAAAYYASIGRDLNSRLQRSTEAEMDQLVSSQSTSDSCDLHGVDVKNGVRIASERVQGWWASTSRSVHHGGYRIIVGRGTHSEGGKSRLQPAVLKMLISQGWKVEVGSGVLLVRGVTSVAGGAAAARKR